MTSDTRSAKKQQAHEVTRDVTAWACCCLGPILLATRSAAWARLGPLSRSAVSCEQRLRQTVDRDRIRRDRSPNGVAWRFPDWTAVGFAFPGPVPRIGHPHSPVTRVLLLSWTRWFDGTADSLRAAP